MKKRILIGVSFLFFVSLFIYFAFFHKPKQEPVVTKREAIHSTLYPKKDIEEAMDVSEQYFKDTCKGCSLLSIRYDEDYSKANVEKYRIHKKDEMLIIMYDLRTDAKGSDPTLTPNTEYKNNIYVVSRSSKDSPWNIINSGDIHS